MTSGPGEERDPGPPPLTHNTPAERRDVHNQSTAKVNTAPAWWVRAFHAIGRPVVVVVGLGMLAPAERHLALVAGYGNTVSWGMAVIMAAYGAIAALTAAYVDRDHPERTTAVYGAVGAVLAAALSQTFAHLIVTGYINVNPRPPIALVILPSIAPAVIVAHLMHLTWVKATVDEEPATAREQLGDDEDDDQDDEEIPWGGLLSTKQAARMAGVEPVTVRGWVKNNKIVPIKKGRYSYFRPEDIRALRPVSEESSHQLALGVAG